MFPLWWIDENTVPYAFVAIVVAAIAGGGAILIPLLMAWATLVFAVGAPPGTGVLRRSLVGLLFVFLLVTAFGVALGAEGRGIAPALVRLVWSESASPWLWTGRIGALGLIVVVLLLYRTLLAPVPPGRSDASGPAVTAGADDPDGSPAAGPPRP
jgi:hypothetical protein